MKALLITYTLGIIGMIGVTYGYAPDEAKQRQTRVILSSLIWPIVLAYAVGQTLGKWAGRQ